MPVDKHDSDTIFTPPPPPLTYLVWSKGKYLTFALTKCVTHTDRGAIDMKHIKLSFRLKAWVGWGGDQNSTFFQNMVMLRIKLKGLMHAAT